MKHTTRALTADLWPALEDLLGNNGAVGGCWCMYWRIGSAYRKRPREENRAAFQKVVKRGRRNLRAVGFEVSSPPTSRVEACKPHEDAHVSPCRVLHGSVCLPKRDRAPNRSPFNVAV
jgi:hypothetical protein